jgi:mono/diheme cytochrome c family protein
MRISAVSAAGRPAAAARGFRFAMTLVLACAAAAPGLDAPPAAADLDRQYTAEIKPLLATYCFECHGDGMKKGGVQLDLLDHHLDQKNVPVWTTARNVLDVASMPPEDATQPKRAERERLLQWIAGSIQRFESDHLENQGNVLLRRINLRAFQNMVQTLTGVRPDISAFQQDGTLQHFDTAGSAIYLTQDQLDQFFDCAQRAIADAVAAHSDKAKPVDLVRNLKKARQGGSRKEADNLEAYLKVHGELTGFPTIHEVPKGQNPYLLNETMKRVVDPAICATYGKKTLAEVEKDGIDWQHDAKCLQAVLERLRPAVERFEKRVDTICEFQPMGPAAHDEFTFQKVQVDIPGIYRVSATMRTFKAGSPLPVKFTADGTTIDTCLVDAPPEAPREYAATVYLTRGEHQLGVSSALPQGAEGGATEMNYYYGWVRVHLGLNLKFSFRNGGTFNDDGRSGPGDIPGYGWRMPEPGFVTVSEFRAQGPIAGGNRTSALDEALSGAVASEPTRENAERRILAFMNRAYVGGAAAERAKPYVDVVMSHFERNKDFGKALQYGLAAVLSSPHFLYLEEVQRPDPAKRRPLAGRELARRLAYFLWSDLPDAELQSAAESGALSDPQQLAAQVHRLLKDPRSAAFRDAFTAQWLRIDHLDSIVIPYELFPGFDPSLFESAKRESVAFFSELLDHDLSVMNFVDSDFVVVNDRLAMHYGIPGVAGAEFRRVSLPPGTHRGGVLGQASVLIAFSNGMTPSLVRRGAFIMEQLLGLPPGVPPPNVPALNKIMTAGPDGQPLTQRDRLAQHRAIASCARCHDKIDPLGVGLENFDAIGAWNDQLQLLTTIKSKDGKHEEQGWVAHAADVSGRLPGGETYDGADALRACLAKQPQRFLRRLTENLMIYALGRDLQQSDGPAIDAICGRVAKSGYGLATLIEQIALSDQFRDK